MKKLLYIVCGLLLTLKVTSQDIHFSQYYNTPLQYNPALTGIFGGDHRIMLAYRNQWLTVASPYVTYGAAFDMRMMEKKGRNFSLGTGLGVYRDVAGDTKMGITNAVLSLSGIITLNNKQYLTIGAQGGIDQRSMDASRQIWGNQYDKDQPEYYNPAAASGEITNYNTSFTGADINAGIAWIYSKSVRRIVNDDNFSLKLGAVYQHITSQDLKYGKTDALYGKMSFQGEGNISVKNSNAAFRPSLIYQRQGPNQEILLGTLIRYKLGFDSQYTGLLSSTAVSIGLHARVGDALIPSIGYEISNWKIMFSYDANLSGLRTASNTVGAFEVTLTFINPSSSQSGRRHNARFN